MWTDWIDGPNVFVWDVPWTFRFVLPRILESRLNSDDRGRRWTVNNLEVEEARGWIPHPRCVGSGRRPTGSFINL